jgi:hypothetical protein
MIFTEVRKVTADATLDDGEYDSVRWTGRQGFAKRVQYPYMYKYLTCLLCTKISENLTKILAKLIFCQTATSITDPKVVSGVAGLTVNVGTDQILFVE